MEETMDSIKAFPTLDLDEVFGNSRLNEGEQRVLENPCVVMILTIPRSASPWWSF